MHVNLCGGGVEGNAHFDVKSRKRAWAFMLKTLLQQDIHLFAFLKINDMGTDKVYLIFNNLTDAPLNSMDSGCN